MTRTPGPEEPMDGAHDGIDESLERRMDELAGTLVPEEDVGTLEVRLEAPEGAEIGGVEGAAIPSRQLAETIARATDERKATDIVTLDLRGISDVTDFFVIATAANNRQADAIVDRVNEVVKGGLGVRPLSVEGRAGLRWVLMDFGPVVAHVFQPEVRDYYRLERLWGDAPRVLFGLEGEAPYEPPLPDDSVREAEETEEDLD